MGYLDFQGESPKNLEEKSCCVFVLDTSGSMTGTKIQQLNDGLQRFRHEILQMPEVRQRLEIAIVTFNSDVQIILKPTLAVSLEIPHLSANGTTRLVDGVREGMNWARERTKWYDDTGQPRKRPWVILITDGYPDEGQDIRRLKRELEQAEDNKEMSFLPIGVEEADMNLLRFLSMGNPHLSARKMEGLKFSEFFKWVSELMSGVVNASPGKRLIPPKADEWAQGVEI
jgi:uncharacterized protein YegL